MDLREEVLRWLNVINWQKDLKDYVEKPSRSAFKDEVSIVANHASTLLKKYGFENVQLLETEYNPVVFGEINRSSGTTVLIYGHFDVQPEGNLEDWLTDPFKMVIRGDKAFGRGTADNKGQHFAHLLAIGFLLEKYPEVFDNVNVKIILDGDEERGSISLPDVFKEHKSMLVAEFVYVSDGPSLVHTAPTIVGSVRGIIAFEVTVTHNKSDLHSGNFGGIARSATRDLLALIETMVTTEGKVKISGFYDPVIIPSGTESEQLKQLEPIYTRIISEHGIKRAPVYDNNSTQMLNQFLPTLNINGIQAGGVGKYRRTIIPNKATASIDCRLVPKMNPNAVKLLLMKHIENWAKENEIQNSVKVEFEATMAPVMNSLKSKYTKILKKSATTGFGSPPVLVPRLGGSLPTYLFPKYLKIPVFLVPYALPDENNHAPNENLDIPYFKSGVAMTVALLKNLANL